MGYGLVAGLRGNEMMRMGPGVILDLFIYRRNYDDAQHGIRREIEKIFD